MDALRVRPHRQPAAVPEGEPARRRDGRVREVGPGEPRADGAGGRTGRRLRLGEHRLLRGRGDQEAGEVALVGEGVLLLPHRRRAQSRLRPQRVLLPLGDDAQERAVPDDGDDAGHPAGGLLVQRHQDGAARGRPHDAAEQHPVRAEVVEEAAPAGHLVGHVDAGQGAPHHSVVGGRLGRGTGLEVTVQRHRRGQLPVADAAPVGRGDAAVGHRQLAGGNGQPGGGLREEQRPHLGAHGAQRTARVHDRQAARGVGLVGADVGGSRHHADAAGVDVELLGDDLRERRQQALAELDLARADGDGAVGPDGQPAVQAGCRAETGIGHAPHVLAQSTARTMRLCAPQRQRLPSSARRTAASSASGSSSSSAAAVTSIPAVQ